MFLYLLILLRIIDRDYEQLFVLMFFLVICEFKLECRWISQDLVLGPRTRKCISPIHLNLQDHPHQHLENLLVDLARHVMSG